MANHPQSSLPHLSPAGCFQLPERLSATPSWDTAFFSACGLAQCFAKIGKVFTAVQLSPGPLAGRFSVVHLGSISVLMISTNKVLLLNGDKGKNCVCFCLEVSGNNADHRVQCQAFNPHALYGFNQTLEESHFQLSAGSISILTVTKADHFNAFLTRTGHDYLIDPMLTSNCLNLDEAMHLHLANQLSQVLRHPPRTGRDCQLKTQDLLTSFLACLQSQADQFEPFDLSSRQQLVQEFVRWGINNGNGNGNGNNTLDEICQQLYTSRRTLILGTKENFNCGPMELLRTIRLQQVHTLLRSPERRDQAGLHQVSDVAAFCGFRSRGHFAKAYQDHFDESPRTTLMRSA